ncbi:hypothetical protein DSM104299_01539 [Baekduia alba]|uniref:hypothetical protein n=1 Tax=Baekduia alba TaxID=2997333 RepID=UPI002340856E|nr:hypothetical protein [Baekduia alba]WCB92839.1 hypothetical protein DSM104299_01539 [Baekduia alba]
MRSEPTHSTSGRRLLLLVVAALLLGTATSRAAVIGPQETIRPPRVFPVEFGGRAYTQGHRIPFGHVVLRRRIELRKRERRVVRFTCPSSMVSLGPAISEGSTIGFQVRDLGQYHHPTRRFHLSAYRFSGIDEAVGRGRVYLLCGPRAEAVTA